jgi:hypothetical protein
MKLLNKENQLMQTCMQFRHIKGPKGAFNKVMKTLAMGKRQKNIFSPLNKKMAHSIPI